MRPLLVLALTLLVGGCGSMGGTLDEASELFTSGGERVLREPMRPVRGTTRVLVLALDGVGDGVLREALAGGEMPALGALLGAPQDDDRWAHAYAAPGVVSVLPSETAAGWAAVFTGRRPAETGVTGNEWFDRDSLAVFAPVPLSVGTVEQTLAIYTDDLLGEIIQTPTLFERADLRAHVSMGFVHRGADLLTPPDLNDVDDLLEAAVGTVLGGRDAAYEELDDDTWEGVARGVERYGLPDLQVAYFPGVDLVAHASGADAQRQYLVEEVDPHIGRILNLYRERGALANTYVLVVADHGHTETLADDRHSLDGDGPGEPSALLDSLGLRRRDPSIAPDSSAFNVVMTSNEAVGVVYLADRSTCPGPDDVCDWTRPPRLQEDVLPVAQAFYEASATGARVDSLRGTLDLVLARDSDPSGRTCPPYRVFDGRRLVSVVDYLRANPRPDLVGLEQRLGWMTDGPLGHRAGDVLLLAKAGADRPIEERFYFGSPRVSGHGSAAASDSLIPLLLAREGADGAALRDLLRRAVGEAPTQLDVTPLVLALLGVEEAP